MKLCISGVILSVLLLSFSVKADVTIVAVWEDSKTGETWPGQTIYISGTSVRIDSAQASTLYLGPKRYFLNSKRHEYRVQDASQIAALASHAQSEEHPGHRLSKVGVQRTINRTACDEYELFEGDLLTRRSCFAQFNELPGGEEVREVSLRITKMLAPLEKVADPVGLIEQPTIVSKEIDGFPLGMQPVRAANETELVVVEWRTDPIARDIFTIPEGYTQR